MRLKNVAAMIALILVGVLTVGCVDGSAPYDPGNVAGPGEKVETKDVVNYGNNVYYFPYTKADFGNALSRFMEDHPALKVSSLASNIDHGVDVGYFVTFEVKTNTCK